MEELDQKSQEFIKRTLAKLEDNKEYLALVNEVMYQTFRFYMDTPKTVIIELAKEKMINGAKEHGEPKTDPVALTREVRMEDIDKLVWTAMFMEAIK